MFPPPLWIDRVNIILEMILGEYLVVFGSVDLVETFHFIIYELYFSLFSMFSYW